MRRLGRVVLGTVLLLVVSAVPALAQSTSNLPPPGGDIIENPPGGNIIEPPGGTAFTGPGTSIPLWVVLAALLLIAGVGLLVASRRRRVTQSA